jgi:hypothetical protein
MESNVQIGKIVVTVLKATRGNVLHRRITHRGDVYQLVGQLPGRHSFDRRGHTALQHLRDVEYRHEIAIDGERSRRINTSQCGNNTHALLLFTY